MRFRKSASSFATRPWPSRRPRSRRSASVWIPPSSADRHDGKRHLEVQVGNVETPCGGRQVFGAVAKSDTDITTLISRNLEAVGRTDDSDLTAFTDGCSGLRSILAAAGVTKPPVLDWFHIAMRLQHAKLA